MVVILVEEEKMMEMLVVVVGVVDRSPSPTLPKGRELIPAVFCAVWRDALPLGRVGEGLLGWLGRGFSAAACEHTTIGFYLLTSTWG